MENKKIIQSIPWGISPFDNHTGGIPANDITVMETPDYHLGQIVLGQFIHHGLVKGERCVLITFDTAVTFLENFLNWNLDFQKYIDNEQLILLNYKGNISNEVGLTHKYDSLFEEIQRLCGGSVPHRIAIDQIDALINLNNLILMNQSAQKLAVAANQPITAETTILGNFVQFGDETHRNLSIALQKTMKGYFCLDRPNNFSPHELLFETKKLPWFGYNYHQMPIRIVEGTGFETRRPQAHEVA